MTSPWKQPVPGTEFANGKLIRFTKTTITVTKPWPPQSWHKTTGRPWRHVAFSFEVESATDQQFQEHIDRAVAELAVTPSVWEPDGKGGKKLREPNADGTIGTPFTDGWYSPLPQPDQGLAEECDDEEFEDGGRSRGLLRSIIADTRFQMCVPERARLALKGFEHRQKPSLLILLARGGEAAYDLLKSNPALAVGLANLPLLIPGITKPWRTARALLKRRQRIITERLGFPTGEASVRLLRKLTKRDLTASQLLFLRTVVTKDAEAFKAISHLPHFTARELVLCTMEATRNIISPGFIRQVSELPKNNEGPCRDLMDTLLMGPQVHGPQWKPPMFHSLAQLHRLHDQFAEICGGAEGEDRVFGQAPLPGNELIKPLTNEIQLRQEGTAMRNCVGGYVEQVLMGKVFIYHLELPEEPCTVSLTKKAGGWALGELKAFANARPSGLARKTVEQWLKTKREVSAHALLPA